MIWEELDQTLIFNDLMVEDTDDVMKKIGNSFINRGYAKPSFVEALISREKEFPTGLDVDGMGVAIPHTDISHVIKTGIAIAVLKSPVKFIQMGSDEDAVMVKIIFMLAVTDPNLHLEKLQRIIAMIQDKGVLKQLVDANCTEKIIEIIKEKEKSL